MDQIIEYLEHRIASLDAQAKRLRQDHLNAVEDAQRIREAVALLRACT